jgi:hypothetical protein
MGKGRKRISAIRSAIRNQGQATSDRKATASHQRPESSDREEEKLENRKQKIGGGPEWRVKSQQGLGGEENRRDPSKRSAPSRLAGCNSGSVFGLNRAKVNWREEEEVPEPFLVR